MLPREKGAIDVVGEGEARKSKRTCGKAKGWKSDNKERSECPDKDGPMDVPGGGCKNCETVSV